MQQCFGTPAVLAVTHSAVWRRVHSIDEGRLLQAAARHQDLVTCIAATPCGRFLISGMRPHLEKFLLRIVSKSLTTLCAHPCRPNGVGLLLL